MNKKTVFVGLSGGVDSSVSAALLLEQGYDVVGVYMRNWSDTEFTKETECPWIQDSQDAMMVADTLGIPFRIIDFSAEYHSKVVDYMFAEYEQGRTPNPDVLCNREIKFSVFLDKCLSLGADLVATGHYCQKDTIEKEGTTVYRLLAGADANKDQSYFLCQLNQFQLSKTLFPIGNLQKSEVRDKAKQLGLHLHSKKDSQGLCFVGHIDLPTFLQQKLKPKKGNVIRIDKGLKVDYDTYYNPILQPHNGNIIGTHQGAHYYTVGQRKGLGIGGFVEPLFVIATDVISNTIYVGEGKDHPLLYKKKLVVHADNVHWLRTDVLAELDYPYPVMARVRYRQALKPAELHRTNLGLEVQFKQPLSAITPGQFVAWYNTENELLGSGIIQ